MCYILTIQWYDSRLQGSLEHWVLVAIVYILILEKASLWYELKN